MLKILNYISDKIKNDIVLSVSFFLAVLSAFVIKSDIKDYFCSYINYSVIVLLFCFMTCVAGLSKHGFLKKTANTVLSKTKNARIAALVIIIATFISSMFITNDVALITFVPVCLILFKEAHNQSQLIKVVTFQTIAANIGSALTPFGNPQNLFLYTYYSLDFISFIKIAYIPVLLGLVLLIASSLTVIPKEISQRRTEKIPFSKKKTVLYLVLFAVSMFPIFHIWHYSVSLIITVASVLIFDRGILRKIDYNLLFTFVCFFIFIGNMQKFPGLWEIVNTKLHSQSSVYTAGVGLSQIISNVPAAILLSGFTNNFKALILGVNVGGLGTLIASLANIISYNYFRNFRKSQKNKYIKYFLSVNIIYLVIVFILIYFIL